MTATGVFGEKRGDDAIHSAQVEPKIWHKFACETSDLDLALH
jgi:hypothetical protein